MIIPGKTRHVVRILKIAIAHLHDSTGHDLDFGSDRLYSFSDMTRLVHPSLLYWNQENTIRTRCYGDGPGVCILPRHAQANTYVL